MPGRLMSRLQTITMNEAQYGHGTYE
jgi:hypothetical protein